MYSQVKVWMKMLGSWITLLSIFSCGRTLEPVTPIVPVHLELSLRSSQWRVLSSPGTIVVIAAPHSASDRVGYGGIIVAHALIEDRYYAYDAACPVERDADVRLSVDGLVLRCPQCHSTFDPLHSHGAPISGVAHVPLRQYRAVYDPIRQVVRITN